jgi:hypothetical protein
MALSSVYKISMFSIAYLMKEYGLQRAGTAWFYSILNEKSR